MDEFHGLPPFMQTSPGLTIANISSEPLATEGEATPGPDDINPYRSEEERQMVDQIRQQATQRQESELTKTVGFGTETRIQENDRYGEEDVQEGMHDVTLPFGNTRLQTNPRLFEW